LYRLDVIRIREEVTDVTRLRRPAAVRCDYVFLPDIAEQIASFIRVFGLLCVTGMLQTALASHPSTPPIHRANSIFQREA
jgi:hypothetical protein